MVKVLKVLHLFKIKDYLFKIQTKRKTHTQMGLWEILLTTEESNSRISHMVLKHKEKW